MAARTITAQIPGSPFRLNAQRWVPNGDLAQRRQGSSVDRVLVGFVVAGLAVASVLGVMALLRSDVTPMIRVALDAMGRPLPNLPF